jgi:type IV pilus assembly protein PilE
MTMHAMQEKQTSLAGILALVPSEWHKVIGIASAANATLATHGNGPIDCPCCPESPGHHGSTAAKQIDAGFTLIELLVACVIVGILATAAFSTYQTQVRRATRSAAEQFMLTIADRQTQYLLDARAYASSIGAGGLNLAPPTTVVNNYNVTITLVAGPPPGYLVTATPIGRQAGDGALTLDSTGQKLPVDKW